MIALLAIFTAKNKSRRQKMLQAFKTIQKAINKQNRSR
jgi:hypothetical protein